LAKTTATTSPAHELYCKLPITLNEQTRGLAFVKEIAKYYIQRRGVLTWTAGIAYARQDAPNWKRRTCS